MAEAREILDTLDRAGYRRTSPRRALAELVDEQDGHFTAADLQAIAADRRLDLSRATLFRGLELLAELRILERIDLPDRTHAYVRCAARHHHHVVCSRCGRTAEVEDHGLAEAVADIARRTGYRIEGHRLELFGLCRRCQAKTATSATPTATAV